MKISLPPQLSAISRYATIVLPVTVPPTPDETGDILTRPRPGAS